MSERERHAAEIDEAIWRIYHESKTLDDVSEMSGTQFEHFLANLFSKMDYTEISLTPSNDQGGDLICVSPGGAPIVVQAKRWKDPVGNNAVQELLGAMRHYRCSKGIVVTNSTFTRAAVKLAGVAGDVRLYDRRWLDEQMVRFLPRSLPEFNREGFDQVMIELTEFTRRAASMNNIQSRKRRVSRDYSFMGILRFAAESKGKELTAKEIRSFGQHCLALAESESESRELEKKMAELRETIRDHEEEIASIDSALAEATLHDQRWSNH